MPRPPKDRRVEYLPEVRFFKPAGVRRTDLEEVVLNVEELEAIRLKDIEELNQEECAERMEVSRPTFQRVLTAGRKKIAEALIMGKGIRIQGGDFSVALSQVDCLNCGEQFVVPVYHTRHRGEVYCPHCGEIVRKTKGGRKRRMHGQNPGLNK
ncbi:MAG: DUF134 domain-containing protein [Halanaerobium sp.]|nr:DUF134 domain-containing protein [Halanaerobium sp.]